MPRPAVVVAVAGARVPRTMRHVALIYDGKLPYDLKVISGVALYVQEGANFITYIEEDALKNQKLPDLRSWRGDGIIADFDDPGVADAVLRSKLPAVGFGGGYGWYLQDSGIPYFFSDQRMIGEMAADHLKAGINTWQSNYNAALQHRFPMIRDAGCKMNWIYNGDAGDVGVHYPNSVYPNVSKQEMLQGAMKAASLA